MLNTLNYIVKLTEGQTLKALFTIILDTSPNNSYRILRPLTSITRPYRLTP